MVVSAITIVRYWTFVVYKIGLVAAEAALEKNQQENPLELLTKNHVDQEVAAAVDGHQQIARLGQWVVDEVVEGLRYVHHQGKEIEGEEHYHHTQQHGRQTDLPFFGAWQSLAFSIRPFHLPINEAIQDGQRQEGYYVIYNQVTPVYIQIDVHLVGSQGRGPNTVQNVGNIIVFGARRNHFPEARQVVERRKEHTDNEVNLRSAIGTQGARLQRVAHGHVPLQRYRKRHVYAGRLRNHAYGKHHRRYVRKDVVVVEEEVARVGIYGRYAEEQHRRYNQDGITAGQANEQIVNARTHLRTGQYNHGDHVADYAQNTDNIQTDSTNPELHESFMVLGVVELLTGILLVIWVRIIDAAIQAVLSEVLGGRCKYTAVATVARIRHGGVVIEVVAAMVDVTNALDKVIRINGRRIELANVICFGFGRR